MSKTKRNRWRSRVADAVRARFVRNAAELLTKLGKCKTGKRWYPDQFEAEQALGKVRRQRGKRALVMVVECRVYPCRMCGGWHLTSQDDKRKEADHVRP